MNEKELLERLQNDIQDTVEFMSYAKAAEKLIEFLQQYVPTEQHEYLGLLLHGYAEKSTGVARRMDKLAEEIACEE